MNIVSLCNTKGGVGKTVTAVNLGAALAQNGYSVLLIDTDLQAGMTTYFDVDITGAPTTSDVLAGGAGLEEAAIFLRERLFLVPATSEMERSELELAAASGGEVRLKRAFRRFEQAEHTTFDFAFIDCPSGWGAVTRNALLASEYLLVPINSEPAATTRAVQTVASARELADYHDHDLALLGVLLTRMRQTNAARTIETQACRMWPNDMFQTRIRQAERLNELAIMRETTSDVSASSAGGVGSDYALLAREILSRITAKNGG